MLQQDSALAGIGCVIFDEFHERSLNADLGLALSIESQQNLREDLRLLCQPPSIWHPLRACCETRRSCPRTGAQFLQVRTDSLSPRTTCIR